MSVDSIEEGIERSFELLLFNSMVIPKKTNGHEARVESNQVQDQSTDSSLDEVLRLQVDDHEAPHCVVQLEVRHCHVPQEAVKEQFCMKFVLNLRNFLSFAELQDEEE